MLLAYQILTGAALLLLLVLLLRAGTARAASVWGLAALLPVLIALTAALGSQAQAERELRGYQPQSSVAVVRTAGVEYDVVLDGREAACLERTLRLKTRTSLRLNEGAPIPIDASTEVIGPLPSARVVEALGIRGQLQCRDLEHRPAGS